MKIEKRSIAPKIELTIWAIIIIAMSTLDWLEHISRQNQPFQDIKLKWFIYSISTALYIYLGTIFLYALYQKIVSYFYKKNKSLYSKFNYSFS